MSTEASNVRVLPFRSTTIEPDDAAVGRLWDAVMSRPERPAYRPGRRKRCPAGSGRGVSWSSPDHRPAA